MAILHLFAPVLRPDPFPSVRFSGFRLPTSQAQRTTQQFLLFLQNPTHLPIHIFPPSLLLPPVYPSPIRHAMMSFAQVAKRTAVGGLRQQIAQRSEWFCLFVFECVVGRAVILREGSGETSRQKQKECERGRGGTKGGTDETRGRERQVRAEGRAGRLMATLPFLCPVSPRLDQLSAASCPSSTSSP